ncbi:MAG TPA: hypothetical protein PLW95_03490 [bacterium]|nr:hypothetical protein [bacterium]
MSKTEKVKEYAKKCGADLVGISSPERFEGAPLQMDPRQIMPGVKSIIVLGFRVFRGTFRGIEEGTFFSNYSSMGYGGISNIQMPMVLWNFCKIIEDKGYEAIPLGHLSPWRAIDENGEIKKGYSRPVAPGKPTPDVMIHHRIAAFCAGLGEIGYSKVFLTPEFGPRQRLGEVLTDMPLDPDPLYEGPAICDRCMECVKGCPAGAISRIKTVKVEVAGKMLEWGELDVEKCSIGLRGGRKVKEGEKGDYLQGRSDVKPGMHSPFYHKPPNVFIHGEAICGGRGCIRACMIHLEKQGKLKNKFKDPFRKETPWRVNWD